MLSAAGSSVLCCASRVSSRWTRRRCDSVVSRSRLAFTHAVSIAPFDMARVVGYRWPSDQMALLQPGPLPVTLAVGAASSNEA